jgi:hypothetical protein
VRLLTQEAYRSIGRINIRINGKRLLLEEGRGGKGEGKKERKKKKRKKGKQRGGGKAERREAKRKKKGVK